MTSWLKSTNQLKLGSPVMKNIEDFYPLAPMQEGMLFHTLYSPDSGVYFQQWSATLRGDIDLDALTRAWQRVVDRHPSLRTSFLWQGVKEPVQIVQKQVPIKIDYKDWRELDVEEKQREFERFLVVERKQGFDLSVAPLMRFVLIRIEDKGYKFIWSHHHLLLDGWSRPIIFKELISYYDVFCQGGELTLERPRPYRNYISWLKQQDLSKAEQFWRNELRGFKAPTALPVDKAYPEADNHQELYGEQQLKLSAELTAELTRLARTHQLTLNTLAQGAWAILLSAYSGEKDVVYGTTVSGRPADLEGAESIVGLFINTLPVRVQIDDDQNLEVWLKNLQQQQLELRQYEYSPLIQVQSWSEIPRGTSLFESILVFENIPVESPSGGSKSQFEIRSDRAYERNNFPITVVVLPGQELIIEIWYDSRVFEQETVSRMLSHFKNVLEAMSKGINATLADLSLISDSEFHHLIHSFNSSSVQFPSHLTFLDLFAHQLLASPSLPAASADASSISFQQLDASANQLARLLSSRGIISGSRVGILLHHSFDTLISILAVLKLGAAYVPLDPSHPSSRISFICQDADLSLLISQEELADDFSCPVLMVDSDRHLLDEFSSDDIDQNVTPDDLAYIIYTSGSSGKPKGVRITHRNLLNYICWAKEVYLQGRKMDFALYTSLAFDLTVTTIFTPLISGNCIHIYPKKGAHTPLLEILEEKKAGLLKLTPSHLELVKEMDNRASGVKVLIVGGEALETRLAREVIKSFGEVEIYNEYGPTETTVGCMIHRYEEKRDGRRAVPIGVPAANTQIYILDEKKRPVGENVLGEIYIGGEGVGAGYQKLEQETKERFEENPYVEGGRMYRSGDMGRMLSRGVVEYVGRRDRQVKYHGMRVELEEISEALRGYEGVRQSAVMKVEEGGREELVAYYVAREEIEEKKLREHMKKRVIEETMPSVYVRVKRMPLTMNGKVNYEALREVKREEVRVEKEGREEESGIEEIVKGICSEVLRREDVRMEDNFFEKGGHSLLATQVVTRVREAVGVEIGLRKVFEAKSIREISREVEEGMREREGRGKVEEIKREERKGEEELSYGQQRIWIEQEMEPESSAYNVPAGVRMIGEMDERRLEEAMREVVRRHEVMRARMEVKGGRVVQEIEGMEKWEGMRVVNVEEMGEEEREEEVKRIGGEEARRKFELRKGGLMRSTMIRKSEKERVMVIVMHHIISDGWSMGIMIREVTEKYNSEVEGREARLAELKIGYVDYARWERSKEVEERREKEKEYWKKQLKGMGTTELPTDHSRPAVRKAHGEGISVQIPADLSTSIKSLSRREGVTLFMTLLAAFKCLLYRYTGQDDLVIGTPSANRSRIETEPLIGFFVNMLILRTNLSGNPTFKELLRRIREVTLGAYAHQEVPFEMIVDELQLERDLSRTPGFQTVLALQSASRLNSQFSGIKVTSFPLSNQTTMYDLIIGLVDAESGIAGSIMYNTDIFEQSTIKQLFDHLVKILEQVVSKPETKLLDIELPVDNEPRWQSSASVAGSAYEVEQFNF